MNQSHKHKNNTQVKREEKVWNDMFIVYNRLMVSEFMMIVEIIK